MRSVSRRLAAAAFLPAVSAPLSEEARTDVQPPAVWHSQYGQDRFVYERFFATDVADAVVAGRPPPRGIFVELGAGDGVHLSNSLAFEQSLGWTGVLIEASTESFRQLQQNRPASSCVHECVARVTGQYAFQEDGLNSGFSEFRILEGRDVEQRRCRTLTDILTDHLGPSATISYLSLDVEGAELDVLQSLNLHRYPIEVLSIEVSHFRDQHHTRRLATFLAQRGFEFVDRLVDDEIYVRRRGLTPDPGCLVPAVALQEGGGGWSRPGAVLWKMWLALDSWRGLPFEDIQPRLPGFEEAYLPAILDLWQSADPSAVESQCPIGMMTLALAFNLFRNRKTLQPLDAGGLTDELRRQAIFHPTKRLDVMLEGYGYGFQEGVTSFERAGKQFEVRLQLGRPWHETRFADAIVSGWPFFGFMDVLTRVIGSGGHPFEQRNLGTGMYRVPVRVPRLPCALELNKEGRRAKLSVRKVRGRGHKASSSDLAFDSDTCSMLGMAAAHFHSARAELELYSHEPRQSYWTPLANWTAATAATDTRPDGASGLAQDRAAQCVASSFGRCSALDASAQPVPPGRLKRLVPSPGQSLRLRRSGLLRSDRGRWVAARIDEGERLLKEYVQRHGLFPAIWASSMPALSPLGGGGGESADDGFASGGPLGEAGRENLFGVLHAIQRMLLADELAGEPGETGVRPEPGA